MNYNIYQISVKYTMQSEDIFICYKNDKTYLNDLSLPIFPSDSVVEFHYVLDDKTEGSTSISFGTFEKFKIDGIENLDSSQKEELGDIINSKGFPTCHPLKDVNFNAQLHYDDITELELFDTLPIRKGMLIDRKHGLWSYHGLRHIKFTLEDFDIDGITSIKSDNIDIKLSAKFDKKDNAILTNPIIIKQLKWDKTNNENEFFGYVDTNEIGDEFTDSTQHYLFSGQLQISLNKNNSDDMSYDISFPLRVVVHNSNYYKDEKVKSVKLSNQVVSIDFGTSSTCVAVRGDKDIELFTLASHDLLDKDYDANLYENPTNLMIYNWDNLCEQWCYNNNNFPTLKKVSCDSSKDDYDYDFGYTVNDILENTESNSLNAILTQIKQIPFILERGNQLEVWPLKKGKNSVIKLVDSPDKQDEQSLDPIALYGYLIGRSINNPLNGSIYTKFNLTYPVKFNEKVKNNLRSSLEFGLKRSIPYPLREAVDLNNIPVFRVEMKYSEPIAYVGAIVGKHLTCSFGKPELFAVYDLGGGTLDSTFGMYSSDEDGAGFIDIFGIDGNENIGGESLIAYVSYQIYSSASNVESMVENKIPFVRPNGEQIPNNFPETLLNNTNIAKYNLRKFNEYFSRKLFKNEITANSTQSMELLNEDNNPIKIDNISYEHEIMKSLLEIKIEKTIKNFHSSILSNFSRNISKINEKSGSFDPTDVTNIKIYKSGNASRSVIVDEKMKEIFPDNKIYLIDEAADGTKNYKYAITPKTAVAFGQLSLTNYDIPMPKESMFQWNIANIRTSDGSFNTIIQKNSDDKGWKRFGKFHNPEIDLYCSEQEIITKDDVTQTLTIPINTYEGVKGIFYIRIVDEISIEYHISLTDLDKPKDDSEIKPNNVVKIIN